MRTKVLIAIIIVLTFTVASSASAALWSRGYGTITAGGQAEGQSFKLIYDDEQDITWLDYSFSPANWFVQTSLVDSLIVNVNGQDVKEWRLPTTDQSVINLNGGFGFSGPDSAGNYNYRIGFNMGTSSEMAHLYYIGLNNLGEYAIDGTNPQPGWGLMNTGPFSNLVPSTYWSGTEVQLLTSAAWGISFFSGDQGFSPKSFNLPTIGYALAVIPGDINQIAPIPLPAAAYLLAASLGGLGLLKRVRR